jgi:hypothetical protein
MDGSAAVCLTSCYSWSQLKFCGSGKGSWEAQPASWLLRLNQFGAASLLKDSAPRTTFEKPGSAAAKDYI